VPRGVYGNGGRNTITGPAMSSTDFTLMKDFPVRERLRAQLRGEFFNAFNQVNFNQPIANLSSSTFGRITGAGPGRVVQLAAKLIW